MSSTPSITIHYEGTAQQVSWRGIGYADGDGFNSYLTQKVAVRVHDDEGRNQFEGALRGLASTGFANDSLRAILEADEPESRDWAIGEALAEVHLAETHGVTWPWHTERDKRNPSASLPGADLVGLISDSQGFLFALGEVKCSSEATYPPQVMNGRGGMVHQLDTIAGDLHILGQLLRWLYHRCVNTPHEPSYKQAAQRLLESSNRAVRLFGVLVRDTKPDHKDLSGRGKAIAKKIKTPTQCELSALHLPCRIADLPARCTGGAP